MLQTGKICVDWVPFLTLKGRFAGEIYDAKENLVFELCYTARGRSRYQRLLASARRRTDHRRSGRRGGGSAAELARGDGAQYRVGGGVLRGILSQSRQGAGAMQRRAPTRPSNLQQEREWRDGGQW